MIGYMKLMVEAIPLEILAYPMSRVIDVAARRILRRIIFQVSLIELNRRLFFLKKAYTINTIPAMPHRYESTSKFESPAVSRPKLKRGEKPNEADDMMA